MDEICWKYYTNLFALSVDVPIPQIHAKQQVLSALINEVWNTVFQMKSERPPNINISSSWWA